MRNILASFALCLILFSIIAAQESGGSSVTVQGQVVCSVCWSEADRKVTPYGNEGDLKCAVDCMKKGKSQAIAISGENGFILYVLEQGKLKRDRVDWLDYIAKRVKVTGTVREADGKKYLQVDSIEVAPSEDKPKVVPGAPGKKEPDAPIGKQER